MPGTASETLEPTGLARSRWGEQLRGMAVSGALARATENALPGFGVAHLRPVRWTVDLFRPAAACPSSVDVAAVKLGRRLAVVDAVFVQDGRAVSRSSAVLLRPGERPEGRVWSSSDGAEAPPPGSCPTSGERRLYFSPSVGWAGSTGRHTNGEQLRSWHTPTPVVEGEEPSPFQFAASVADVANVVANLGTAGLQFVNVDLTTYLSRLPSGGELGLRCVQRHVVGGVAVATVVLHDRAGDLGTTSVSAMANATSAIDFTADVPRAE